MARPKGREKKDLSIALGLDVYDWLTELWKKGEIDSRSFFIECILRQVMEQEKEEKNG